MASAVCRPPLISTSLSSSPWSTQAGTCTDARAAVRLGDAMIAPSGALGHRGIRRVRRLVPELAEVWVREHNIEGGRPPCDWGDPADRDRLVSELVNDANEPVWAAPKFR